VPYDCAPETKFVSDALEANKIFLKITIFLNVTLNSLVELK
jgi:hypothetical protein